MSTLKQVFDRLYPTASQDDCVALVWMTPYPFVDFEKVTECLERMREEFGPNIEDAICGEMEKFDKIWEETREEREKDLQNES